MRRRPIGRHAASSISVLSSCGSKPSIRLHSADVRVGRLLRLHADQVLDDGLGRAIDSLEQELPPEQRPVEGRR